MSRLYELTGVEMRYESRKALEIEHLALPPESACALLGPNGSGKTTLLHILALLTPPSFGEVRFMGEPVSWREKSLLPLRRKVVLVDQHPIMFSATVLDNAAYGLKMRGIKSAERNRIAMENLERVGMADHADRPAHQLSGGETRRVAIARALACRPEVLLLDEPTAGVDSENLVVVEKIIFDVCKQENISVVFSTHSPMQAERLAAEKIFLERGRLSAPAPENRFRLETLKQIDFFARMLAGNNPHANLFIQESDGGAYVTIDPAKIRVHAGGKESRLYGKILRMIAETSGVRVVLDVLDRDGGSAGILLTALMDAGAVRSEGIVPGDVVGVGLGSRNGGQSNNLR